MACQAQHQVHQIWCRWVATRQVPDLPGKGLSPWENIGLCQTGFKTGQDWAVQLPGKEELFLSKTYVKGAVPSVKTEEGLKLTPRKKLFKINIWTIPGTCYSTFSFKVFCKT